jgi:hypothetical protein
MRLFNKYRPTNHIWLVSTQQKARELCDVDPSKSPAGDHRRVGNMHFVHRMDKTVGSVALGDVDGFSIGPQEEDRIYNVVAEGDD